MTCQPCVMYPPDILCLHTFSQIILGSFQGTVKDYAQIYLQTPAE